MKEKRNKVQLSGLILMILFMINCTGVNVFTKSFEYGAVTNPTPEYANIFSNFKGGGIFHKRIIPGAIGSNSDGSLRGEGCSFSVLYLVSFGDSSIETAKKKANITKVSSLEYEQFAILGSVYHSFCTIVTGEGNNSALPASNVEPVTNSKTPAKKGK